MFDYLTALAFANFWTVQLVLWAAIILPALCLVNAANRDHSGDGALAALIVAIPVAVLAFLGLLASAVFGVVAAVREREPEFVLPAAVIIAGAVIIILSWRRAVRDAESLPPPT